MDGLVGHRKELGGEEVRILTLETMNLHLVASSVGGGGVWVSRSWRPGWSQPPEAEVTT